MSNSGALLLGPSFLTLSLIHPSTISMHARIVSRILIHPGNFRVYNLGVQSSTHLGDGDPTHFSNDDPTHLGNDEPTHLGDGGPTHLRNNNPNRLDTSDLSDFSDGDLDSSRQRETLKCVGEGKFDLIR